MVDDLPQTPVDPSPETPEYSAAAPTQPQRAFEQHQEENKDSKGGILLAILLLVAIIVGGFYGMNFLKGKDTKEMEKPAVEMNETIPLAKQAEATKVAPKPKITEEKKEPKKESKGIQVKAPDKGPETTVEDFYAWVLSQPGDIFKDGSYKDRPELYKTFIQKLENRKENALHPFLCSATSAAIAEVQTPKTSQGLSSVAVNLTENGKIIPLKVSLKLNGAWTITDIMCISENGKRSTIENLKLEAGLDYAVLKDMSFLWNYPDYKGRLARTIVGKGFSTENTSVDPSVFKNFFLKNGYTKDKYNENGYRKDNVVCVAYVEKTESGQLDAKAVCGRL